MIFRLVLKALKKPLKSFNFLRFFALRPNTYILATMHQSGTHWAEDILAKILSPDIPYAFARNVIPKLDQGCVYEKDSSRPKISHTHAAQNFFLFKPVIILVRDLRDATVSQYEKYKKANNKEISFSEFLQKPSDELVAGKQTLESRVHFLNSWAKVKNGLTIYYEELKQNPESEIKRILNFVGVNVSDSDISVAVNESSLEKMKEEQGDMVVNKGIVGRYREYFSDEDKKYFQDYLRENLLDSYGYDYAEW
jgi:hypothetical protein